MNLETILLIQCTYCNQQRLVCWLGGWMLLFYVKSAFSAIGTEAICFEDIYLPVLLQLCLIRFVLVWIFGDPKIARTLARIIAYKHRKSVSPLSLYRDNPLQGKKHFQTPNFQNFLDRGWTHSGETPWPLDYRHHNKQLQCTSYVYCNETLKKSLKNLILTNILPLILSTFRCLSYKDDNYLWLYHLCRYF